MQELLRIAELSPAAEWLALGLIFAFAMVQLGHRAIGLLQAWDEYRVNRPVARKPKENHPLL